MDSARLAPEMVEALVAKARAAVPVLAAHAAAAEERCRISPESTEKLRELGAFALTTPREFGGLGADLVTKVRVLSELGRGCPSSAWVAAVSAETKTTFSRLMPEEVLAEFYADPDVRLCGGSTPGQAVEVPDGVKITGRWAYASGAEDAQWAVAMVMFVAGDGSPRLAGALLPTSDLEIERTWQTAGMRGTGSHTLVADGVFVPTARVLEMPVDANGMPDPTFGKPLGLIAACPPTMAPLAGAARGALDTVEALLRKRKPPLGAYQDLTEMPAARNMFAEAEHLVSNGQDRLLALAERIQQLLDDERTSDVQPSVFRMEIVAIIGQFRRAVDLLLDLHGSSGFALSSPLQRLWRDLNVGARHAQFTTYLTVENRGLVATGAGAPILPD
ncbi:acyl-CoA dehydrogenase family protein [Amycolatopsis sp. GM8]|uniref:acyl-CoA dehydrogenase family protein n=1 Tax=Amycolatopsis sp. GM8 TaxID=2896530 RepID=UPI001F21FD14|nr:acyl-CoA dehydrogenase family protein [Amycolatopsis sp. GM8]